MRFATCMMLMANLLETSHNMYLIESLSHFTENFNAFLLVRYTRESTNVVQYSTTPGCSTTSCPVMATKLVLLKLYRKTTGSA